MKKEYCKTKQGNVFIGHFFFFSHFLWRSYIYTLYMSRKIFKKLFNEVTEHFLFVTLISEQKIAFKDLK